MKKYISIIILFFLSACSYYPENYFDIKSISQPNANLKKKYILISDFKDIKPDDPQYKEYAAYVNKALSLEGFIHVSNPAKADIVILLGYAIGPGQMREVTYSAPIYGQTGISSATTYGNIYNFGNTSTYASTTTFTPQYGIVGYAPKTEMVMFYPHRMWMRAVDLNKYRTMKKQIQLWELVVDTVESDENITHTFPMLVAAGRFYIGRNGEDQITLTEGSNYVKEIKKK